MNITVQIDNLLTVDAGPWPAMDQLQAHVDAAVTLTMNWLTSQENRIFPAHQMELSCLFTDDASIQTINKQWRNMDKPTNVLSFPIKQISTDEVPPPMLGDLIFSFQTIDREASDHRIEFTAHLTHLIIHGFLHLLGYDHISDEDAQQMEAIETGILASIGLSSPYKDEI